MTGHANILSITLKVPGRRNEHYPTGNLISILECGPDATSQSWKCLSWHQRNAVIFSSGTSSEMCGVVVQVEGHISSAMFWRATWRSRWARIWSRSADGQARMAWAVCRDDDLAETDQCVTGVDSVKSESLWLNVANATCIRPASPVNVGTSVCV